MNRYFLPTFLLVPLLFLTPWLYAQNSEIKFTSVVSSVAQTSELEGNLEVSLHGVMVSLLVNGDTEIEDAGEEVAIGAVSAGDYVRVDAFFSEAGIVADEITVVDSRREQFRFRGVIEAVSGTDTSAVLTIMGADVLVNVSTDITRRSGGDGNDVLPSELMAGELINVSGGYDGGSLVAERIHIGEREQGTVEIDGTVTAFDATSLSVDIGGELIVLVILDENTTIRGTLALDSYVEIEGQFNEELAILGFEVVIDEDGDGDADDDNSRGRRGDDRGRDDDDGDSSSDKDRTKIGREIQLRSDIMAINGKAEYSFEESNSEIEQEFEIEIEDAQQGEVFTIMVYFADTGVEFGTLETDEDGNAEAEFKIDADDPDENDLTVLFPAGSDVRDISSVAILQDGVTILESEF